VLDLVEKLEWLPIRLKLGKNEERKESPPEESNTNWIEKEAESYGPGKSTHE
jgi:hypothetical protein